MTATLAAAQLPSALATMTTATVVGILCAAVVVEIVVLPAVLLPGATITLLAGAMIGTGPAFAVAIPVAAAVIGGDQLAYVTGTAVTSWWRHRRGRGPIRHGVGQAWFVAAFPSLAGAAGLRYRPFAVRVVMLRIPWLAAALGAGALAGDSIARIGHVAGIVGIAASCLAVAGLLIARRRAASARRAKG